MKSNRPKAVAKVKALQDAINKLKWEVDSLRDVLETAPLPFDKKELEEYKAAIRAHIAQLQKTKV